MILKNVISILRAMEQLQENTGKMYGGMRSVKITPLVLVYEKENNHNSINRLIFLMWMWEHNR